MLELIPGGTYRLAPPPGAPGRTLVVTLLPGEFAKADEPNTRWITMRPHGPDSDNVLRVKIRMNPDGSAHVVSGPKDLRGLRLTKLASNEELRERARNRRRERGAKKRQAREESEARRAAEDERAQADPEFAKELSERRGKELEAEERRAKLLEAHRKEVEKLAAAAAAAASDLTGEERLQLAGESEEERAARVRELRSAAAGAADPADEGEAADAAFDADVSGGAAAMVAARDRRRAEAAMNRLEREIITELVRDDQLAAAVLNGEEADLTALQPSGRGARVGYRQNASGLAQQRGFTPEDAAREKEAAYQARLAQMDPEAADASLKAREVMRRMTRTASRLGKDPEFSAFAESPPDVSVDPEALAEKAERTRAFLEAQQKLRAARQQLRAIELGEDPDATLEERTALAEHDELPEGLDLARPSDDASAFRAELEARIADAAEAELTMQFLDAVDEDAEHANLPPERVRENMLAHVHAGAGAHLTNATLTLTGAEGVDRMVIDTLGVQAAAALTAHQLRRDLDPAELAITQDGLAQHHDEHSLALMRDAMTAAEEARAAAAEIDTPPINGTVDAALVMDLLNQKQEQLEAAQAALGSALGQVEGGAALNLALRAGPQEKLTIDYGRRDTAAVATSLRALGLTDKHYTLERDPESNLLTATINAAGMDALTQPLDAERAATRRDVAAIKDGGQDEADWVPAGFARRAGATFERGAEPPSLRGEPAYGPDSDPAGATREYAASLYADGYTPSQIYAELTSVTFQQGVPLSQRDAVNQAIDSLLPMRQRTPRLTKAAQEALEAEMRASGADPSPEEVQRAADERARDLAAREEHLPAGHADRSTYVEVTGRDIDADETVTRELDQLAQAYLAERFPGETPFHAQRLDPQDERTREALFRTLAKNPALQAAYHDPAELDHATARAIRNYYLKNVLEPTLGGVTYQDDAKARKDEYARATNELEARWKRLAGGELPPKFRAADDGNMFAIFGGNDGDDAITLEFKSSSDEAARADALTALGLKPEHYRANPNGSVTLTEEGKEALDLRAAAARLAQITQQREQHQAAGGDESDFRPDVDDSPLAAIASGLESVNPQHLEYLAERRQLDRKYAGGRGRWAEFLEHAGSPARAYAAVQEHMRGALARAFVDERGSVTGTKLRVSKLTTEHHRSILRATDPDALERLRRLDQQTDESNRAREGGRYVSMGGAGALVGMRDESQAAAQRDTTAVASALFSLTPPADEPQGLFGDQPALLGGETTARAARDIRPEAWERVTLGHAVESTIGRMLRERPFGITASDSPTSLIPDVTWGAGTAHVGKQRFVKALERGRKLGLFFGTGTGKTATQLGGFTHLHAAGKATKGLFVVPSSVRNQFGEEALRFLEPGRYRWHARSDSFEGRLAAYKDPGTHMVVVTHAAFRDDMVKIIARHRADGEAGDERATSEWLRGLPPMERTEVMAAALRAEGIEPSTLYTALDESHDFLHRAGKPDSLQGMLADSLIELSGYAVPATGSPVKNDLSEAYDWLRKLDPQRFADRDAFMRRYGVNTEASREAFQRVMAQYSMVDANEPPVVTRETWGRRGETGDAEPIALTKPQQAAYRAVHEAATAATRARRAGRVDVAALKLLSPNSFAGAPPSEHAAIAAKLNRSVGTLKHSALNRVLNEHPAAENAKVQHVLQLANDYRLAGKAGVIFADHRASVAMLREELTRAGHKVGVIDGSASGDEKAAVRRAFDNGEVDIVIASRAGETGMNLQKRGRWLIQYNLPDTQKSVEQRTARIKRLGQTNDIEIHHLQTDARVDDLARRRIARKARLGSSLQGAYQSVDDTGLAATLANAQLERGGDLFDLDPPPPPPALEREPASAPN